MKRVRKHEALGRSTPSHSYCSYNLKDMLRLNEAAKVLESVNFVSYCKGSLFFHLFSCDRERP